MSQAPGAEEQVTCPTCDGTGRVISTRCIGHLTTGQRCTSPARVVTDPTFLLARPMLTYPPHFMAYCGRHGNLLRRRLREQQRE